jgi:hypothetical protein
MADDNSVDNNNTTFIEEDDSKKRKAEEQLAPDNAQKQKVKFINYVPYEFLSPEVMEKCIRFKDPFVPVGKAGTVAITFDYPTFRKLVGDACPEIRPKIARALFTNHPYFQSSFGYSPHPGEDGKIANNIRYKVEDPINEESRIYVEEVIPRWEKFWLAKALENKKTWPFKLAKKGEKPEDVPDEKIQDRQKSFIRESSNSEFSDYIQFQAPSIKGNEKLNVKEDPYTANLKVWNFEGKKITDTLYARNGTDYEGDDKEVIFDRDMYARGVFQMKHIAIQEAGFGLTCVEHEIKIARKEDLVKEEQKNSEEEVCSL